MKRSNRLIASMVLAAAVLVSVRAVADEAKAAAALNAPLSATQDTGKSWKLILQAAAAMTPPPRPVGPDFNVLSIWPGMQDWAQVKEWAAANAGMGRAIVEAQGAYIFGMPYGRAAIPPEMVEKGLYVAVGEGANQFVTAPKYLKALDGVAAYVIAEMYRLGEEKKFKEAFELGLASLRVWRQVADQQLLEEKSWALDAISDLASVQRDWMWTFLDEIPVAPLKRMAQDGYPFVSKSDGERLRRVEMPEGDRIVAEIALEEMFDSRGQPDHAKFIAVLSPLQAKSEPLTQFGAARWWDSIADVHGSLDATKAKVASIYDDWWRRWKVRYFDPLLDNPTALSHTNRVRYAMVMLLAKDLESVFELRKRANAELNGLVLATGLCAWHRDLGNWPRSLDQGYTQYIRKRYDYDPFDPGYGRWHYESLASSKPVDCEFGRVELTGGLLYALGRDKQDSGGIAASKDGLTGDFIAWPPLRALARQQHAKQPATAPATPPGTPPAKPDSTKSP